MKVFVGGADTAIEPKTGTLVVDLSLDSVPTVNKAQVSLLAGATHHDVIYGDSAIKITAPAGRYLFRARMIGAQTIQDSVDVRSGFVDTIKVMLGRVVVCQLSRGPST
jgi:hypothetical protein